MSEVEPGSLIQGRYRLDRKVRSGGTSTRWLGIDERLGQPVMVDEFFMPSGDQHIPFLAHVACQLRLGVQLAGHPRLLGVRTMIDTGGDQRWLVFDVENGITLKELLQQRGRLSEPEVRVIAGHVLEALTAMHAAGFIHHDVKPANIIVAADGSAQLTGCDIARDATVAAVESRDTTIGTPGWMAPERFSGVRDDPRSDVFGLGVTLYEALSGTSPFQRDTVNEVMSAITSDEPPLLPAPEDPFPRLVMRMLAKDPGQRPTAEAALSELGSATTWVMTGVDGKIKEARRTKAPYLDLSAFSAKALPSAIGSLTDLRCLVLAGMGLQALPPEIGRLHRLEVLVLSDNLLSSIPEEIRGLTSLRELRIDRNPLQRFPEQITSLHELMLLDLAATGLDEIPSWALRWVSRLSVLELSGNHRLAYPPPAIVSQGPEATASFLRAAVAAPRRQWRSKLLIVGEGGVGKTTLLKVLTKREPDPREPTTHGLNIEELELPHPGEQGTTMRLAAWDFGGQQIYHAVHQFFLTGQSLMLLVWNARAGWEQSRGRYWLDQIVARTGDRGAVPVLLVATHCADRAPDLPLADLTAEYPQIVGSVQVDAFAGIGGEDLRRALADAAALLPLMGASWPATWSRAAQACRNIEDPYLGSGQFDDLLVRNGVLDATERRTLTAMLHGVGDILHFADDPELSSGVVLKPQWLSQRIAAILDSPQVGARHGLLTAGDLVREWPDVEPGLRGQLLFLMERYDLCYRVHDDLDGKPASADPARAIVVDRLPWDPPPFADVWNGLAPPAGRELRLYYVLGGSVPPGIPGWFIARAHQFATTGLRPWRDGVLLAHPDGAHLGLVRIDRETRTVELAVRGRRPAAFLGMLELYFQATLKRHPGLTAQRVVPCPCRPGCPTRWPHEQLLDRADMGKTVVECGSSLIDVAIAELVEGYVPRPVAVADGHVVTLRRLEDEPDGLTVVSRGVAGAGRQDLDVMHLRFAGLMAWMKVATPTVFTVTENRRRVPGTHRYTLRLYCAEPEAVHPLPEDRGCYQVTDLQPWLGAVTRHLARITKLLAPAVGLTGKVLGGGVLDVGVLGAGAPEMLATASEDLKKVDELLKKLPGTTDPAIDRGGAEAVFDHAVTEADARMIENLLLHVDPARRWGGLSKTLTPSGLVLYLCEEHAAVYSASSPRPLDI